VNHSQSQQNDASSSGAAQATSTDHQPTPAANDDDDNPPPPESPPLPTKHTAVTPGPRAARLQALFASTLKHTLDKISRDNFAACFPTIATRAPGTLEFVQRQMVERLGAQCNVSLLLLFFFTACCVVEYRRCEFPVISGLGDAERARFGPDFLML